jgi:hypothetical protein
MFRPKPHVLVDLKITGAQVRVVVDNDQGTHSQHTKKLLSIFFLKKNRWSSSLCGRQ